MERVKSIHPICIGSGGEAKLNQLIFRNSIENALANRFTFSTGFSLALNKIWALSRSPKTDFGKSIMILFGPHPLNLLLSGNKKVAPPLHPRMERG